LEEQKRKSTATTLMRDMPGTATQKLALFEKLKAAGGFDLQDRARLGMTEKMLGTFAATEKENG
jgi:hypothetical protein